MNLFIVTWSYDDHKDISETRLVKSFLKYNEKDKLHHLHFNRSNYKSLESEFESRFGYQFEFLLYRIFLLREYLINLDVDNLVFSDTDDVVCMGNIDEFNSYLNDKVIFSSESHQYPNEINIINWTPVNKYPDINKKLSQYLNAGLSFGEKDSYIKLFNFCIDEVMSQNYRNFGGDQGVFTYSLLNSDGELLSLDQNNIFLNTYCLNYAGYYVDNNKLYKHGIEKPFLFVHDNGWNYGSPKFIEHFNL